MFPLTATSPENSPEICYPSKKNLCKTLISPRRQNVLLNLFIRKSFPLVNLNTEMNKSNKKTQSNKKQLTEAAICSTISTQQTTGNWLYPIFFFRGLSQRTQRMWTMSRGGRQSGSRKQMRPWENNNALPRASLPPCGASQASSRTCNLSPVCSHLCLGQWSSLSSAGVKWLIKILLSL